ELQGWNEQDDAGEQTEAGRHRRKGRLLHAYRLPRSGPGRWAAEPIQVVHRRGTGADHGRVSEQSPLAPVAIVEDERLAKLHLGTGLVDVPEATSQQDAVTLGEAIDVQVLLHGKARLDPYLHLLLQRLQRKGEDIGVGGLPLRENDRPQRTFGALLVLR